MVISEHLTVQWTRITCSSVTLSPPKKKVIKWWQQTIRNDYSVNWNRLKVTLKRHQYYQDQGLNLFIFFNYTDSIDKTTWTLKYFSIETDSKNMTSEQWNLEPWAGQLVEEMTGARRVICKTELIFLNPSNDWSDCTFKCVDCFLKDVYVFTHLN